MEVRWHIQVEEHAVILGLFRPVIKPCLENIDFSWVGAA